jgi:hypothetical protein
MQAVHYTCGALAPGTARPRAPRAPPSLLLRRRRSPPRPRAASTGAPAPLQPRGDSPGDSANLGPFDSDDSSDDPLGADAIYSPGNVFEALPPTPNVGRKRQVAGLVAAAIMEFTATGAFGCRLVGCIEWLVGPSVGWHPGCIVRRCTTIVPYPTNPLMSR